MNSPTVKPRSTSYKVLKSFALCFIGVVLIVGGVFSYVANQKADAIRADLTHATVVNCVRTLVAAPYSAIYLKTHHVYPRNKREAMHWPGVPYRPGQPNDVEAFVVATIPKRCPKQ